MGPFLYRLMGAALLDAGMYEGIENDPRATWQAGATVLLSSLAAGIGAGGVYGPRSTTLLVFSGIALATWVAWAMLVFQIGARWLPGPDTRADVGQLLRTVGFAASPGLFQAFAILPRVSTMVFVISWFWMLAAMIVAVKHALDYRGTGRAIAVCALSAGLALALAMVLGLVLGEPVS